LGLPVLNFNHLRSASWASKPKHRELSGAWRFKNTRVPVKASFENLESGATVDQFPEWFPGVTKQQAFAVLETAAKE